MRQQQAADGTTVILAEPPEQPLRAITSSPLFDEIGRDNITATLALALERAELNLENRP